MSVGLKKFEFTAWRMPVVDKGAASDAFLGCAARLDARLLALQHVLCLGESIAAIMKPALGAVAQLGEHSVRNAEVVSLILIPPPEASRCLPPGRRFSRLKAK